MCIHYNIRDDFRVITKYEIIIVHRYVKKRVDGKIF